MPPSAASSDRLVLESEWLRVEVDASTGAIVGLAADPEGGGDFSHPLLRAAPPSATDAPARRYGILPACRSTDGDLLLAQPGPNLTITPRAQAAVVEGLRIGERLSARMELALAADVEAHGSAPSLIVRTVIRAAETTPCQWAGLVLALEPALAPSTVYFAGHQGLAAAARGRLTVGEAPHAGAVCKDGEERTFVLTCQPISGVEIEVEPERVTLAASPALGASPADLRPGGAVAVEARITFGRPRIEALKPVTSKLLPLEQDFVFWTSHVATTRRFGERWAQETAAVIDPGLPADIQNAYRRCWLRDVAHGWKSGALVAGEQMLAVMRDQIRLFAERLDAAGHPPTSVGPDGDATWGNLDSAGLLIGMIYDYLSRTGEVEFVRSLMPQAERMGGAIMGLLGPRDLPVIPEGADTYPDLGFIKGEQTYLTAVCYDGLHKLARLHEVMGEAEAAARWHVAANRVAIAANRLADDRGLWDPEQGTYIGWRRPDGSLHRDEESFANLWAIASNLCNDGERVRAIFHRLNSNWQRYYQDGLCPTAHSIRPYPNGLDQWVPWIGGWDVYLRTKLAEPRAFDVWRLYLADYQRTDFPFREASGYRQQEANVGNRGRVWDSWGFLYAIYAGHYGIEMTPAHLRIMPRSLEPVVNDEVRGLRWHDGVYDISVRARGLHLARVTLDGKELASCVLPPGSGRRRVEITRSPGARKAFIIDCAPTLAVLGARHRNQGIEIEASAPAAGIYWLVLQWPDEWGPAHVTAARGADFPLVSRAADDRVAVLATFAAPGKFNITLEALAAVLTPPAR